MNSSHKYNFLGDKSQKIINFEIKLIIQHLNFMVNDIIFL
jgi:hypothetical protein